MENQDFKITKYQERFSLIDADGKPKSNIIEHELKTLKTIPKLGVMLVGLGGENGVTVTAGILANKKNLKWKTKKGEAHANYFGSFTQCVTTKIGIKIQKDDKGNQKMEDVYKPIKDLLPMVNPNDLVIGGWDISDADLYTAANNAHTLEPDLIEQLKSELTGMKPLPAAMNPDYVTASYKERANNVKKGTNHELVEQLRHDMQNFVKTHNTTKLIVLWTSNTEKFFEKEIATPEELEKLIETNQSLPASILYATAALKEKAIYINGASQNTIQPALVKMAEKEGIPIAGSDLKTGQTKYKTAMGDFLIGSGLRCASVVSYNHVGNNDGKSITDPQIFKSKEHAREAVLEDHIKANNVLYPSGNDKIDHVVVIKYNPFVGDTKKAMDEYTSEIFLQGHNTIMTYNICENSALAAPVIIDLCLLAELMTRIFVDNKPMGPALSYLSYFFKKPVTNHTEYILNSFSRQSQALTSLLKACAGYTPDDNTLLSFHY